MRIVFFLLLLANMAFFAWTWFTQNASGESQLVDQQLHPEAIKLLTPDQVAKASAKQVPKPSQAAAKSEPEAAAPRKAPGPAAGKTADAQPAPKAPAPVKVAACVELGAFNAADAAKVEQALAPLALGARVSQRHVEETAGFWVYVPPQSNRQGANRKVAELRKLGVGEFFIVQDDPEYRYAISLGVFKSREAARSRLAELRTKGVRSARVGARETQVPKVLFSVRDVPEPEAARLNEVRQAFPGAELKDCPAEKPLPPAAPA
ncbi:MAG TPA: SPOR domain-containing protein [Burkholderiales bacterium]|nr:SPOR domain-containing protein [Burkholderiales bacterium]